MSGASAAKAAKHTQPVGKRMWKYRYYYLFLLPAAFILIYFNFIPTFATILLAFKNFDPISGIWGSPFNGLYNFTNVFGMNDFMEVVGNTVLLSLFSLIWGFLPPIILAIFLFDLRKVWYRKTIQTLTYLPHFLSWPIIYGLLYIIFSPAVGMVPAVLNFVGVKFPDLLSDPSYYRTVYIASAIWKEIGWGAIIYLAALAGVEREMYEAAAIDGAGIWQRTTRITLPSIFPVIILLLTLNMGNLFNVSLEQTMLFLNGSNSMQGDVIGSWVFRVGLQFADYNSAAAVGLLQSIMGVILVFFTNWIAKKSTGTGALWG